MLHFSRSIESTVINLYNVRQLIYAMKFQKVLAEFQDDANPADFLRYKVCDRFRCIVMVVHTECVCLLFPNPLTPTRCSRAAQLLKKKLNSAADEIAAFKQSGINGDTHTASEHQDAKVILWRPSLLRLLLRHIRCAYSYADHLLLFAVALAYDSFRKRICRNASRRCQTDKRLFYGAGRGGGD